jgi:hypothetical protein
MKQKRIKPRNPLVAYMRENCKPSRIPNKKKNLPRKAKHKKGQNYV